MVQLKHVTEMLQNQKAARPVMGGTIKKGESKESAAAGGRKTPADQDFFRMHPADGWGHLTDAFTDEFGDQPREFLAILPFEAIDDVLSTAYLGYGTDAKTGKGALKRMCDGCHILQDRKHSGEFLTLNPTDEDGQPMQCCMVGKHPAEKPECGSKLTLDLWLEIPVLNQPCIYRVQSHAWSDVRTVTAGLLSIQETLARLNRLSPDFNQDLQGIPVQVSRRETINAAQKRVAKNGQTTVVAGERTSRVDWNIYIEFDPRYYESISYVLQAQQTMRLQGHVRQAQAMLDGGNVTIPQLKGAEIPLLDASVVEPVSVLSVVGGSVKDTKFYKALSSSAAKVDSLDKLEKLQGWVEAHEKEVYHLPDAQSAIEALLAPLFEEFAQVEAVPVPSVPTAASVGNAFANDEDF